MFKFLRIVFNRWTLLALLLGVVLLVIWVIGPLVAVGEWHPLDTVASRWITTGALLVALALSVAGRMWRGRRGNRQVVAQLVAAPVGPVASADSADLAAVRERFEAAMNTLRKARFDPAGSVGPVVGNAGKAGQGVIARLTRQLGGRYLYELPWYMFIGAPGSGKTTALRNAGLQFPLAAQMGDEAVRGVGGTRNCDWWFTQQAVLVDTAGRFTTQDSDRANDKSTWTGFLSMLKKSRPRQPLNGVLVTVSVTDLLTRSAAERAAYARSVGQRLQELHEHLAVRLPVYLLVTKCDLMSGFMDTFAALDKAQRNTPWGFTFAADRQAAWQASLGPEFEALLARLNDGLLDQLQAETDAQRRTRIYGFPNQFATLRGPLEEFVQQVFAPSPFEPDPLLRGVYFVSGTQEGTPIDRVLGAVSRRYRLEQAVLPPLRASGRSYFLQRLLTEVVFAEQGMAGADRRWERRRRALALGGYAVLALGVAGMLTAWTISWRNNRSYIETVAARAAAVQKQVQETPNRASPDLLPLLDALDATRDLAAASGAGPRQVPWSYGFGLYQGHKLDSAARAAYERMLPDVVLPRLALRVEAQLRGNEQPEPQYEALKAYLMMYDTTHFDAAALKAYIEADWDAQQAREILPEQRAALSRHLDALLARGAAVSPLPQDGPLVDATRNRLAAVQLPQRVYNRLRQRGLGAEFPEFTVVKAGGGNAALVFTRSKGAPLTRGVPGLYTYNGYHKGFQSVVREATQQLAEEQSWVLGLPAVETKGAGALLGSEKLINDVRRLYLNDYRDTWREFIADIKLQAPGSMAQLLERTRFLAAPDSPLPPLLKAMSRETTLLAGEGALGKVSEGARGVVEKVQGKVFDAIGAKPASSGAPAARIESIVDDEFVKLRYLVTAPEGGKAPIDSVVGRLGELQVLLTSVDAALKGGAAPPSSPLPNQMKVDAVNSAEPVRTILDSLGSTASALGGLTLRDSLSREVRSQVGEFCSQAVNGRYPFDAGAAREVTPADFAALFGPNGKFEQMQTKLAPYIDTTTRPWRFRQVEGTPLGGDSGTLPQFERAQVIRETFFSGGAGPSTQLTFKPVEMDTTIKVFTLDVDGQQVRYDHGPQLPQAVKWPGPRGSNVVRMSLDPTGAGSNGLVNDGPWALFRLFDRVSLQPQSAPEKFRALFDVDGRKAVFEVTAASVRNPLRLPALRGFQCPNGL